MLKDLRRMYGYCNPLEKVRLVDNSKRITSPYFNIFIPSMMNGIEPSLEDNVLKVTKVNLLNDDQSEFEDTITLAGCIRAKSIHPYTFKHEGWIPEFKTASSTYAEMTMSTGTGESIASSSSIGEADAVPSHPTHPITKALKLLTNTFKKFKFSTNTSSTMVHTNSTEVDYQELNRKYIKTNHVLYGCFVSGGDSDDFVVSAIDDVVSYYDEDEDNLENNFINTEDK